MARKTINKRSMDSFVISTLTEWMLTDLVQIFKGYMVHSRMVPWASHWIPGGKAAYYQEEAEINHHIVEHGTHTASMVLLQERLKII
ncbi:hypothetical protein ILYODFUR_037160 [Ilyodon furcidens]|uniref:Uncharacterized protein n=1 Tax=Ilyodon furcidens TaxID=33524 RepID=A0ABV0VC35_9TELE